MFFAIQGGWWVYFALHHGLLPPSECIPLHKCLRFYHYITFQPMVARPGCYPCWSLRCLPQIPPFHVPTPHSKTPTPPPSASTRHTYTFVQPPKCAHIHICIPPHPSNSTQATVPRPFMSQQPIQKEPHTSIRINTPYLHLW
jgi:hypothetical protein